MSERRAFLDEGFGERRGLVVLDGRPERLLFERDGEPASQRLGAGSVARVRTIERGLNLAFLDPVVLFDQEADVLRRYFTSTLDALDVLEMYAAIDGEP